MFLREPLTPSIFHKCDIKDQHFIQQDFCFVFFQEVPDDNYDLPYHHQNDNGEAVMIKIDVPVPLREEPRFPKEKWKTFIGKREMKYPQNFNEINF